MSEAFEKFMESQCEDCAFEFIDDAEYCTECGLRFKAAYTAGLLRAVEIAEEKVSGQMSGRSYEFDMGVKQAAYKISAAIRKEAGE